MLCHSVTSRPRIWRMVEMLTCLVIRTRRLTPAGSPYGDAAPADNQSVTEAESSRGSSTASATRRRVATRYCSAAEIKKPSLAQ